MNFYINYPSWIDPYVFGKSMLIRWYSVMYIVAFGLAYFLLAYLIKRRQTTLCKTLTLEKLPDLVIFCAIFIVIGARIASCLIYSNSPDIDGKGFYYWRKPWMIFWPFTNGHFTGFMGMSFHGGVIGGIIGMLIFGKKYKIKFFDITDSCAVVIPFCYTFGRLGNFFNSELYGKVSTSRLGMIFPDATPFKTNEPWVQDVIRKVGIESNEYFINLPRFPSQLYEAFFEGIVAGAIMWFLVKPNINKFKSGFATGIYLISYGVFRFFIEYLREPDENMGYIFKWGKKSDNIHIFSSFLNISTGQILCFLMIVAGIVILLCTQREHNTEKSK